ncbi:type II toxin-antitoxin system RelE/ParE family toxin [Legionella pneumophila serogroup 1]
MMKKVEFIAYEGEAYTIEWYFDDKKHSDGLEYYNSLDKSEKIQLLKLLKRMGDNGEIKDKTKFRNEGDKIYAFKPQPERFLCFFYEGKKIIITNGFCKKQQKLPTNEKDKAINSRNDYISRVERGKYYD